MQREVRKDRNGAGHSLLGNSWAHLCSYSSDIDSIIFIWSCPIGETAFTPHRIQHTRYFRKMSVPTGRAVLSLYKQLLRTAVTHPTKKRASIIREIQNGTQKRFWKEANLVLCFRSLCAVILVIVDQETLNEIAGFRESRNETDPKKLEALFAESFAALKEMRRYEVLTKSTSADLKFNLHFWVCIWFTHNKIQNRLWRAQWRNFR